MPSSVLVPAFQSVAASRDGLSRAGDVATIAIAVAVVVLAVLIGLFVIRLNGAVAELRRSMRQTLGPVSERARRVSDNVEFITQALRTDVERLTESVEALTGRLHQASDYMEQRIEEFNALMEVVQTEAEDLFLDTAATMRGVREGARSITTREGEPLAPPRATTGSRAEGDPEREPRATSDP